MKSEIITVGYQIESGKIPRKWSCLVVKKNEFEKCCEHYKDKENYHCFHDKGKYIILYLDMEEKISEEWENLKLREAYKNGANSLNSAEKIEKAYRLGLERKPLKFD